MANDTDDDVPADRGALRWRLRSRGPVSMFRHGWQWSASGSETGWAAALITHDRP